MWSFASWWSPLFLARNCPNFAVIGLSTVWIFVCNAIVFPPGISSSFSDFLAFNQFPPKASANLFCQGISFAIRCSRSSMGAILNSGCHSGEPPWSGTYETQTSYWRNCKAKKGVYTGHSTPETCVVALHTCGWKTFAKWLYLDRTCGDLKSLLAI